MVIKIWYEVELVATFLGFLRIKGRRVCDVAAPAVDPAGPAADHGMQSGDVILVVAGKSVSSPADVSREIAGRQAHCADAGEVDQRRQVRRDSSRKRVTGVRRGMLAGHARSRGM